MWAPLHAVASFYTHSRIRGGCGSTTPQINHAMQSLIELLVRHLPKARTSAHLCASQRACAGIDVSTDIDVRNSSRYQEQPEPELTPRASRAT
jgi:hypothetical protein